MEDKVVLDVQVSAGISFALEKKQTGLPDVNIDISLFKDTEDEQYQIRVWGSQGALSDKSLICLIERPISEVGKGDDMVQSAIDLVLADEAFQKGFAEYVNGLNTKKVSPALVEVPNKTIQSFTYGDFLIEVVDGEDDFREFWLSHKDCGIEELMFGIPAKDAATVEDMKALISPLIDRHIKVYQEKHMDE